MIRDIKPDIVYIPHSQDGNRDHQVTHHLLIEACQRAGAPFSLNVVHNNGESLLF